MLKVNVVRNMQINKGIVKIKLADGRYFATKVSDDCTVLRQSADTWVKLADDETVSKSDTVVYLNDCNDEKAKKVRTIAVNDEFMSWALGTGFSFTVKNGKATLSLTTFTAEEMKANLAEEIPANLAVEIPDKPKKQRKPAEAILAN